MSQPPSPEPPCLGTSDRRRLQNLASVVSRRSDFLAGQIAGMRAGLQRGEPMSATEAMRKTEEMMTDYAHLGHGLRDLLNAAKSIYREAEARKASAGDAPAHAAGDAA